jgi:8-oxo-dGTP pyrophosphatase MutT (NUDIX family)
LQETIPLRAAAPEVVNVREAGVVLRKAGQVLLVQRPGRGRWANLWEFPHGE